MRQKWKRTSSVAMGMALSFLIWESAARSAEKSADEEAPEDTPSKTQQKDDLEKEKKDKEAAKKILEWFKRIKFSGDLRYRLEMIDETGKDFRYRNRLRAR
ncbi:MAG: hypothetical protein GY762_16875, partial [Proteobacteria bacterium]|nr:hypothetical protein [Pseudomonadota bacterium]